MQSTNNMELEGAIKSYDWGKLGPESKVATLAQANNSSFVIDNGQCYAELWMGDHVSGPSIIRGTGQSLDQLLANENGLIGGMNKLPFLLKVLSIGKALSIQVHPSKVCPAAVFDVTMKNFLFKIFRPKLRNSLLIVLTYIKIPITNLNWQLLLQHF